MSKRQNIVKEKSGLKRNRTYPAYQTIPEWGGEGQACRKLPSPEVSGARTAGVPPLPARCRCPQDGPYRASDQRERETGGPGGDQGPRQEAKGGRWVPQFGQGSRVQQKRMPRPVGLAASWRMCVKVLVNITEILKHRAGSSQIFYIWKGKITERLIIITKISISHQMDFSFGRDFS